MASYVFKTGAVDKSIKVRAYDSATFLDKTDLVFNSAGLTCYYSSGPTGVATQLVLVTQTLAGAHTDGGFVVIDATNQPGEYRLDLSDAILAGAAGTQVSIKLKATNVVFEPIDILLLADDPAAAAATTTQISDAVVDKVVEGTITLKGALRLVLAVLTGKSTGGGKTFRDIADAKNRVVATTDGSGNRTAVTRDVTD